MFNYSPYDLLQKMDREIIHEESEEPGRCITANKLFCKFGEESNYTGHVEDWNLHKQKVVMKVGTMIDKKTTCKANSNSQLANSQASKRRQPKQKRNSRPKLDRWNALKNFEYDGSSTTSTTSVDDDNDDLTSSSFSSSWASESTSNHSENETENENENDIGTMIDKKTTCKANSNLQLANSQASKQRQPIEMDAKQKRKQVSRGLSPFYHKQKSFRIEGISGELDLICRALGLPGIDDLSIPTADWEAHRSKSDLATRLRNNLASSTSTPTPSRLKPAQPVKLDEDEVVAPNTPRLGGYAENENDVGIVRARDVIPVYRFSPRGKLRRSISSWQKGELLGSGSFGTVYEGYTEDGFFFAVKEVSLLDQGSQGKQNISYLEQEISLLKQFEHENIVQYLGTEKDESRIYIFLELVIKGSLASLYQKYRLRDSQVSAYTRQI